MPSCSVAHGLSAFGTRAAYWSQSIPADLPLVIFDETQAPQALAEAVKRKAAGNPFYACADLLPLSAYLSKLAGPAIMRQTSSFDERRQAFDDLGAGTLLMNGVPSGQIRAMDAAVARTVEDTLRLADSVLTRSDFERYSLVNGYQSPRCTVTPFPDHRVPLVKPRRGDAIVVWAPHLTAEESAVYAIALEEFHTPVILICAGGRLGGLHATFAGLDAAADALSKAGAVVVANETDPGSALALANTGLPLAVSLESGAQEYLSGVATFRSGVRNSIESATYACLGLGSPVVQRSATLTAAPSRPKLTDGPLVSFLVPTFNRPHLLDFALRSISLQTYRNIETIVVNDAGIPVADIVSKHGHARLVNLDVNGGPAVACNEAFRHAKGTYFGFLGDDDTLFPEHTAALVEALETSGKSFAHADVLTTFMRKADTGYEAYGFSVDVLHAMDITKMLVTNLIGPMAALCRRSSIPTDYVLDESLPTLYDYEFWLRSALAHDFVHVQRVTTALSLRNDGSNMAAYWKEKHGDGFRAVYAKHAADKRPVIEQRRNAYLPTVERGGMSPQRPPLEVPPMGWPPQDDTLDQK